MRHLPFPLRVAAGLAVTTAERVRDLPRQMVEFPVTVASQVLQASMRVQQHVTELAIKGDTALSALRRPDETPEWATFDEDLDPGPESGEDTRSTESTPATEPTPSESTRSEPTESPDTSDDPWAMEELALAEDHAEGEFDSPELPGPGIVAARPAGMENYDELTLPQVRARLRTLTLQQLEELLAYEREHADRPSFVGMLTRRIGNVRQAEQSARADQSARPDRTER